MSDETMPLHHRFQHVPSAGQIKVAGRHRAARVDFQGAAADQHRRAVACGVNLGSDLREQAQGRSNLGRSGDAYGMRAKISRHRTCEKMIFRDSNVYIPRPVVEEGRD
jgi:hypothetical protein